MGILLAFIALFSWGIGDFLIQKSTRKFGDWLALFYICLFSVIVLSPFIYKDLGSLASNSRDLIFLIFTSLIILFAALFDFEAFKRGKISVIEPVNALELPVAVFLATFILREPLTFWQGTLIVALIIGIFLVATKSIHHLKNIHAERGVWFALAATIGMGSTSYLFGVGAREISPLMINWFTSLFILIVATCYLAYKSMFKEMIIDLKENKKLIFTVSFFDNVAWIAYSYSMIYIPIAISTGISESYIAMSALLGLFINKEKLQKHQWTGLLICVTAACSLALLTEN